MIPYGEKYEPVEGTDSHDDDDSFTQEENSHSQHKLRKYTSGGPRFWVLTLILVSTVVGLVCGAICFHWGKSEGRLTERQDLESDWFSPPGFINQEFKYREEFGLRPGNESNEAWKKMFPMGRGFVTHPVISPVSHSLAVFHQLHCLDALRRGYWAARDGIEPDHLAGPCHVRHCIDYLRQTLMCHADTNLGPENGDLGGVTGFGFLRKCRDMSKVMAWTAKWRTRD